MPVKTRAVQIRAFGVAFTVFRKTRQHDQGQIGRAVRAQQVCERDHRRAAAQTYERQE